MTLPIAPQHARELARLLQHESRPELVLVGAAALGHHLPLRRPTYDVDLALVMTPREIEALLTTLGWSSDPRVAQRWLGPGGFRADVLPATRELIAAGSVELDGVDRSMSLVGFDLAFEHASEVELEGTPTTVPVASLASIAILKMVSSLERPHERRKDLGDLAMILECALAEDDERRWDSSLALTTGLTFDEQSPFFVGLEVAAIARDAHRRIIDSFIDKILDDSSSDAAAMARAAGIGGENAEDTARERVRMFARGFRAE